MDPFDLLNTPGTLSRFSDHRKSYNGRTIFYVDNEEKLIYLHFETSFDDHLFRKLLDELGDKDYYEINAVVQSHFAKVFMFAASVCHLLILTDPGTSFNSSYLPLFRALSHIRETKFLKYASNSVYGEELFDHLGKELRLCAPKMIFLFDRPEGMEDTQVEQHEIDMEHDIYSCLKAENLLSKNTCLFVLPKKLPFVHVYRGKELVLDPVKESLKHLMEILSGKNEETFIEPKIGYGRPFRSYEKDAVDREIQDAKLAHQQKKVSLKRVIRKHIKEILSSAAGTTAPVEETNKPRSHSHRPNIPSGAVWLEIFSKMYEMLLGQDRMESPDPEYVSR